MSDILDIDDAEDTGLPDNKPISELKDEDLVRKVMRLRKQADKRQSKWRDEARTDFDFVAGEQWTAQEKAIFEELQRVPVVFNRVEPTIESISGHEVNNRQAVKFVPRQPGQDGPVNEVLTAAADWVRDNCDAEDEESDSFVDMLSCGMGWTETLLDYDDNPDGDIRIERVDPLLMRWDPAARKRNLADKQWVQRDLEMTLADIYERWPDRADEVKVAKLVENDSTEGTPHRADQAWKYEDDQQEQNPDKNTRTVVYHQWCEYESFWRTVDPASGQMIDLDRDAKAKVDKAVKAGLTAPAEMVKMKRKVYKHAYIVGAVLLEEGDAPSQRGFTLNCITGRRDRNKNEFYGVVRPMRDPQRFANKYISQMEAHFRSNGKGGVLAEEGAAANPRKFEEDWAKMDSVLWLTPGALSGGKVQPKPINPFPAVGDKILDFSVNSIRDVTGVNLEALGLADRNQAGVLEYQRRESALTILAPLFNSLRRYRKEQGRVLADMIIRYIADGRLIRIVQGDGTEQAIPLLRMPETIDFDVVVDSSSAAPDQKMKTFGVLSQMLPIFERQGIPVIGEVLDYTPLPASLVSKWKQAIQQKASQPPPKPPEVQKAEMQIAADVQKTQAKLAFDKWKAEQDAQLEMFKANLAATTKAQTEQLYAAINEQSQIINAQANAAKSQAEALKARIEGLAKLVDATAKARTSAEKVIEKGTRGPSVIALPMNDGAGEMQAQALQQMAQAVQALGQSINGPRPPLRVFRDAGGNIAGVQ